MIHLTKNFPKNMAMVSYKIHNVCNYTCEYCESNSNNGSERWNLNYQAAVDFLNKVRERNEYLYLDIVGGEPTLWPEFQSFINAVSHKNTLIEVSSNGSRSIRYWENFNAGNNVFSFSWHPKEVDTNHLINVINIMKDKCHVTVNMLITPDSWTKGMDALREFEKLNIGINFLPVRKIMSSSELYPYTPEQLNYIHKYTQPYCENNHPVWLRLLPTKIMFNGVEQNWSELITQNKITFTNWKCNAGIDRFVIDPDGTIFKCWPKVEGRIGNIYGEYEFPTKPAICTYQNPCHCGIDARAEKWSPDFITN